MAGARRAGAPGTAVRKKAVAKKKSVTKKTGAKSATKKRAAPRKVGAGKTRVSTLSPAERFRLIAEMAFLKAEGRGFEGGDPVQDWLEAEKEVDGKLSK